jgi:uncharacterized membrane protein
MATRLTTDRIILAIFFVIAGCMHFIAADAYIRIVPPALPAPRLLVIVSGIAEIAGGLGLLLSFSKTRCLGIGPAPMRRLSRECLHGSRSCSIRRTSGQ